MRLILAWPLLAALLTGLAPAVVLAQDGPTDDELATARREFEAGRAAYEEGRFEDALAHFETAHQITGSPEILYNVATVADRLRRDELALASYERFLREQPETEDREHIEGRIRVLQAAVDRSTASAEDSDPDPGPGAEPTPTDGDGGGGGGRLFTWIALGGAVVLGGLTAGFWAAAQSEYDGFACRPSCDPAAVDASSGPTFQTLGNVFFGVSLAALAAAVVLFFLEGGGSDAPEESDAARATDPGLRFTLSPSAGGLEGRF